MGCTDSCARDVMLQFPNKYKQQLVIYFNLCFPHFHPATTGVPQSLTILLELILQVRDSPSFVLRALQPTLILDFSPSRGVHPFLLVLIHPCLNSTLARLHRTNRIQKTSPVHLSSLILLTGTGMLSGERTEGHGRP